MSFILAYRRMPRLAVIQAEGAAPFDDRSRECRLGHSYGLPNPLLLPLQHSYWEPCIMAKGASCPAMAEGVVNGREIDAARSDHGLDGIGVSRHVLRRRATETRVQA